MTDKNIYKQAMMQRLRFNYKGTITTEDLWSVTLQGLDTMYKELNAELKASQEDSLLSKASQQTEVLELKISIIKDVVKTRQDIASTDLQKRANAEERQKLLAVLAEKQNKKLDELSEEEINARLAQIDADTK